MARPDGAGTPAVPMFRPGIPGPDDLGAKALVLRAAASGFTVACLPSKVKGGSGGWTRAVALFD